MKPGPSIGPRLSLTVIARNEEAFLPDCLKSVEGVVDEVIVVDTGSTDGTVSLAQSYGASVSHFEWCDDFAAARNYALSQSTGEWVLYLDADERLAPSQENLIRTLISDPGVGAYRVAVCGEEVVGLKAQQHRTFSPRLFRRAPGVRFEGAIHEQIGPSLEREGMRVLHSAICVHHLGYAQDEKILRAKAERNLKILRSSVVKEPNDWYLKAQLGSTLSNLGCFPDAAAVIQAALQEVAIPKGVRAMMWNALGEANAGMHDLDGAIEAFSHSLHEAVLQVTARWQLASLYVIRGDPHNAIEILEEMSRLYGQIHSSSDIVHDIVIPEAELRCHLGLLYEQVDQGGPAMKNLTLAVSLSPRMGPAWVGIARLHRRSGRNQEAWNAIRQGVLHQPMEPSLYVLPVRWHVEEGNLAEAERLLNRAEENDVASIELGKLSFEVALRSGNPDRARTSLERLKKLIPADNNSMRSRIDAMSAKVSVLFS